MAILVKNVRFKKKDWESRMSDVDEGKKRNKVDDESER